MIIAIDNLNDGTIKLINFMNVSHIQFTYNKETHEPVSARVHFNGGKDITLQGAEAANLMTGLSRLSTQSNILVPQVSPSRITGIV